MGGGEDIHQNTNCRVSVGANFCYFGVIEKREEDDHDEEEDLHDQIQHGNQV